VKLGDGAADFKPIAHLYKSQVYQLAEYLGVPAEIRERPPTTDTYTLDQTQEEFYFRLPLETLDLCLSAHTRGMSAAELAQASGIAEEQASRVYRMIESNKKMAHYLHSAPLVID
jgi:NAD+ synthase